MAVVRKFGRLVEFDERSRLFPIRKLLPAVAKPRSYTWSCGVTLDQGSTSACTGFAMAQEWAARPVVVKGVTNTTGNDIYRLAQELDEWPGTNYEGSSVLGAAKAAEQLGKILEYRWAFGVDDLILAIGYHGPAVLGVNWYNGMMNPDAKGIIRVTGGVAGGHAILCNGYSITTKLFRLHNSWGPSWGIKGECFVTKMDMSRLLSEQGECCVPVRRHL
jgi:hypothetical protein